MYGNFSILIMSTKSSPLQRYPHQTQEINTRTEVDDIKHLRTPVLCDTSKQLTIRTGRHRNDCSKMRSVVLDEFDALVLFLPEL